MKVRPGVGDLVEAEMWEAGRGHHWRPCRVIAREQRSDGPIRFKVRREPYDNRGPLDWWVTTQWRWAQDRTRPLPQ